MTPDANSVFVPLEQAAALEGISYEALKKRLRRRGVNLSSDHEDARRKLLPVTALSGAAYAAWLKEQAPAAPVVLPQPASLLCNQASLPFQPMTETERKLSGAIPAAVAQHQRPYFDKWAGIIGDARNGTWKKYKGTLLHGIEIKSARDFLRVLAAANAISLSTIYSKLSILKQVESDASVPRDRMHAEFWKRALPRPRPGRSGYSFFANSENSWALEKLHAFYLNQAKLSIKRAWELLCDEIEAKQRAWGAEHVYSKPTLKQCRTALSKIDLPTRTLAREGEKAYNDRCAQNISRRPSEHANDVWVTDQRLCNVRLRDGAERLGRVWVVNFLDVSTWRWLGCMFGPVLNSDMVMAAAAMALERGGVPGAIQMDLGKEFIGKRFLGGIFKVSGEALFRHVMGLWERLGVKPLPAIGRNPQTKPIERWHREVDRFDQEQEGWCGSSPDERPEKLSREEAEHQAWLKEGRGSSPLLTIPDYIGRFWDFCERRWNAEHRGRGRYLQGMTPNEAWNTRQPEGGRRQLTREEIDDYTADRRHLVVARGGQVNLTFHGQTFEYVAPELFYHQGEQVEVIVSRRSIRSVTVIFKVPGGTDSCVAEAKPLLDWLPENRDELRQALRCRAALKRKLKLGLAADRALTSARNLGELPAAAAAIVPEMATFGAPAPALKPAQEQTRCTGDLARDFWREVENG